MTGNRDHLEQRVFRYLYGDLNDREREHFEQELADNPALEALLAEEQALDAILPRGTQPVIHEDRLRWNRAQALRRLHPSGTEHGSLPTLLRHPGWLSAHGAALALAFFLGHATGADPVPASTSPETAVGGLSPLDLVDDDDYELYAMEINSFDPGTGTIDLSFSLASETRFVGNMADENVRALINMALRNNIEDAGRLEAVKVLQYASAEAAPRQQSVPDGLLYALNEDSNPGVRYTAATSLAPLAGNETVRVALRQALSEDTNPGVRLVAFDALVEYPDANSLAVFRQRMVNDGNEYIRDRARAIVEQFEGIGANPAPL